MEKSINGFEFTLKLTFKVKNMSGKLGVVSVYFSLAIKKTINNYVNQKTWEWEILQREEKYDKIKNCGEAYSTEK